MINRNIQMKKKNEGQWENLFPLTLNENVFNTEGIGLTKQLNDLEDGLENLVTDLGETLTKQLNDLYKDKHPIVSEMLKKPSIMAHRGLQDILPENTIENFEVSYEMGIKFFKTDIRETKDGHFVVLHDETTGRTTNQNLTVSNSTLKEIRSLRQTKLVAAEQYDNPKIPTIQELFNFMKTKNVYVNIVFKDGLSIEQQKFIYNLAIEFNVLHKIIFAGISWHKIDNNLCIANGGGIGFSEKEFEKASKNGCMIASYDNGKLDDRDNQINELMRLGTKHNVPIQLYTIKDWNFFRKFNDMGIHSLMVDNAWFRKGGI